MLAELLGIARRGIGCKLLHGRWTPPPTLSLANGQVTVSIPATHEGRDRGYELARLISGAIVDDWYAKLAEGSRVTTCTHDPGHDGPCNGWPAVYCSFAAVRKP